MVTLIAAVIFSWQVGRPGLWRDEAATIAACRRSLGGLFQLSSNLDLVHLAYYLVARIGWQLGGSVTAVRLISVLAMSLAAGTVVLIGRRLGSIRLGTLAGMLLAVNPFASRYAQEARPFAIVALLAAVSTYLCLRLLQEPGRRVQTVYAASLVLLGLFNVLALMLVLTHAGQVWCTGDRAARRRWVAAAAGGLAVVSPFAPGVFVQRGQVSWIESPHLYDVRALLTEAFGSRAAPLVIAAAVLAALAVRRPGSTARAAILLGAFWAVLPPILLFAVSLVLPLWDVHYLLFSLPGLPLLLAGLVPGLNSRSDLHSAIAFAVPVLLVGALGLPAQIAHRDPETGHEEDLGAVSDYLGERAQPGDAVLFVPAELRVLTEVSPEVFATLGDLAVEQTPREAANLTGTPVAAAALPDLLLPYRRAWLIEGLFKHPDVPGSVDDECLALLADQFKSGETRTVTDVRVTLYTRR